MQNYYSTSLLREKAYYCILAGLSTLRHLKRFICNTASKAIESKNRRDGDIQLLPVSFNQSWRLLKRPGVISYILACNKETDIEVSVVCEV